VESGWVAGLVKHAAPNKRVLMNKTTIKSDYLVKYDKRAWLVLDVMPQQLTRGLYLFIYLFYLFLLK